jgi:hypothetical protein
MKESGLPADLQFFADLFSGLVLNPQRALSYKNIICQ